MKMREYFRGRRLEMHSLLPVEDVASCIRSASGSFFWFVDHPVVRGVWTGRLRFNYVRHPFSYYPKAVLDVFLRETANGTALSLTYGATSLSIFLMLSLLVIWALFLSIFLYVLPTGDPQNVSGVMLRSCLLFQRSPLAFTRSGLVMLIEISLALSNCFALMQKPRSCLGVLDLHSFPKWQ